MCSFWFLKYFYYRFCKETIIFLYSYSKFWTIFWMTLSILLPNFKKLLKLFLNFRRGRKLRKVKRKDLEVGLLTAHNSVSLRIIEVASKCVCVVFHERSNFLSLWAQKILCSIFLERSLWKSFTCSQWEVTNKRCECRICSLPWFYVYEML